MCMYLSSIITTRPYQYVYQFAICGSCFWCATIFHKVTIKQEQEEYAIGGSCNDHFQQQMCSVCKNKSISLTPLCKDEICIISIEGKRGPDP